MCDQRPPALRDSEFVSTRLLFSSSRLNSSSGVNLDLLVCCELSCCENNETLRNETLVLILRSVVLPLNSVLPVTRSSSSFCKFEAKMPTCHSLSLSLPNFEDIYSFCRAQKLARFFTLLLLAPETFVCSRSSVTRECFEEKFDQFL